MRRAFRLSWPRIVPHGKGAVNQKGLDFYRRVIDEMLKRNIQPWVTLYHWDLPQALEDVGGWTNRDVAEYFGDYAARVADALGDRVKHWMAFNEPWIFTMLGYTSAYTRRDVTNRSAIKATHTVNLAQGMAVRAIRESKNHPEAVGTAFSMSPVHPETGSLEDRDGGRALASILQHVVPRHRDAGQVSEGLPATARSRITSRFAPATWT